MVSLSAVNIIFFIGLFQGDSVNFQKVTNTDVAGGFSHF